MEKKDLRIVFMGTPEFAVATLKALVENEYNVVAVVTQPDKPVGRHQGEVQPSEVKKYALEHDLPVLQPEKMKDPAFIEKLRSYKANLQVVVAFRMLPEVVWDMPAYGTFNVHAALLPQYRGAAPINWAVINGEEQTGVTTFFLDHDIDTGRIIMQRPCPIAHDADAGMVYDSLMVLGAEICLETIDLILACDGKVETTAQSQYIKEGEELRGAPKIYKDTCKIDWCQSCRRIYDFIRGMSPSPGAWTEVKQEGKPSIVMKIYSSSETDEPCPGAEPGTMKVDRRRLLVATADRWLSLGIIQMAGKKKMAANDFVNGYRL